MIEFMAQVTISTLVQLESSATGGVLPAASAYTLRFLFNNVDIHEYFYLDGPRHNVRCG